ncbi:CehA/McbA family metallohydrolase [Streptomyces krungchingensis]
MWSSNRQSLRRSSSGPRGHGHGWYRGDCHVHSVSSSGGELTPAELVADARSAGLDFLAATEHNTVETHGSWAQHADDDLLVILGQEVVTRSGHWLALGVRPEKGVDWQYGAEDDVVDQHLDEVRRAGGLCVAAHPYAPYPSGTFEYSYQGFDVVEVWNGQWTSDLPWQADNEAALAQWHRMLVADIGQGRWMPAVGNSDTHLKGQLGSPHTVVRADELSVDAVLAGIRAGRSWVAASEAVRLSFAVAAGARGAGIGERLQTGDKPAVVRVDVVGVPHGTVSLHTEQGEVCRASLRGAGSRTAEWRIDAQESAFVRAEIRDGEGRMAALTNPIVLG